MKHPIRFSHQPRRPFMGRRSNRRDFLKQTTLAGVGFWVAGGLTVPESRAASEKLNIACVGVLGKGSSDVDQASHYGNIVALCDIDDNRLNEKANQKDKRTGKQPYINAKKYHDF